MTTAYKDQFKPASPGVKFNVKEEYAQAKLDQANIDGYAEFAPIDVVSYGAAVSASIADNAIEGMGK